MLTNSGDGFPVENNERRGRNPILKYEKTGTCRSQHINVSMVVAKDEIVHSLLFLIIFDELIKRLINTLENIFLIMRKSAMA